MSDATLVEAVRHGDAAAFAELYSTHVRAVTTVVRANVHDRDGIADVVQEVFLRALERLDSLREPDRFRPWLLSIARHSAVDERRRGGRVTVTSDDDHGMDDLASADMGPEERTELGELSALVNGSVAGLSRRDATALALVIHLGYTPTQVAAALRVTAGAAKVILHRARNRLRDVVALEVLVRSHNDRCAVFADLCRGGDPVVAAQHVRRCDLCLQAAGEEVQLYEVPAEGTD